MRRKGRSIGVREDQSKIVVVRAELRAELILARCPPSLANVSSGILARGRSVLVSLNSSLPLACER